MTIATLVQELIDRGYSHVTSDMPCPSCGAWPGRHAELRAAVDAVLSSPAVDRPSEQAELGAALDERDIH